MTRYAIGGLAAAAMLVLMGNAARDWRPRGPVVLYSNEAIGPTDAIDTGVLDTRECSILQWRLWNGNTTVARTMVQTYLGSNGTTVLATANQTAGANATTGITNGPVGLVSNSSNPVALAHGFKLTAAAPGSGTGTGSLAVWCR